MVQSCSRPKRRRRKPCTANTKHNPPNAAGRRADGPPSLTNAQRAHYGAAARRLQQAIHDLPEQVRSQLLNDDAQQFTAVGMPKWLNMFSARATTNESLLDAVYRGAVQAYFEENYARGSGHEFYLATNEVAVRLGMTWEADGRTYGSHWRPARQGENAFSAFAQRIAADGELRAAYLRDKGPCPGSCPRRTWSPGCGLGELIRRRSPGSPISTLAALSTRSAPASPASRIHRPSSVRRRLIISGLRAALGSMRCPAMRPSRPWWRCSMPWATGRSRSTPNTTTA